MNNASKLEIFRAQVENVRSLQAAATQIRRSVNHALRVGNDPMANVQTKILALVFCAWAESNFLKVIHTPYGFTLDEIRQIKSVWSQNGIGGGWLKCLDLALRKVPAARSGFVPNTRQQLKRVIQDYVVRPSVIRNKIAHGQWVKPLNGSNTAVNLTIEADIAALDVVKVSIWFQCHERLADIIESLIESPKKFVRDYWTQTEALRNFLEESQQWSLEEKKRRLAKKPARQS